MLRIQYNGILPECMSVNVSAIKVKCYHNFGIKKKSKSKKFITIAEDKDGNLEMFKHINEKILGVMWHPERESNFKKLDYIFKNFYKK